MKLIHLLSIIATAFTLCRAADYKKYAVVVISVPTPVVHNVSVFAKPSSELDPVTRRAAADVGVGCLKKYRDPVTGQCPYHDYLHVTSVEFLRPTDLPRNITVNFKDYTIQCTFALNRAMDGRVVSWRVHRDWGLDGRKSDFQIACDNSTAYYGEPFGRAESEMPVITAV